MSQSLILVIKFNNVNSLYQTYEKILIDLKSYLCGISYEEATLLSDSKLLDCTITDLCPPINGWAKKYDRKFNKQNTM